MKDLAESVQRSLPSSVVVLTPKSPPASAETIGLLQDILREAQKGEVCGLAVVVLRNGGKFSLQLRGQAAQDGYQMSVAGMLAALQKIVLELH